MSLFLDAFPKVQYDPVRSLYSNYDTVTNILFRMGFIKSVVNNSSVYTKYSITDSDTPEILAEKVYGDPNAYWIILYANDIYDPQYDWPLEYRSFKNFVANKYRTQAAADLSISVSSITDNQVIDWTRKENDPAGKNIHHYERVIERTDSFSDVTTTIIDQIDYQPITSEPHDCYTTLPHIDNAVTDTLRIGDRVVYEKKYSRFVTLYDYEDNLNEKKRQIKLISPQYYTQIIGEFNSMTKNSVDPFMRRLV